MTRMFSGQRFGKIGEKSALKTIKFEKFEKKSENIWREEKSAYLCSPFEKQR